MGRIPDIFVSIIYYFLIVVYGLFSRWLLQLWCKAKGGSKPLLLALFFLTIMMMIDSSIFIFGTGAYVHPPIPALQKWIFANNVWAVEKILWGIAGILVWRSLRVK